MARVATTRLCKKYGDFKNYSELASLIIEDNHKRITTKVAKINNDVFSAERARVTRKEKAVATPPLSDLLPAHVEAIKSKEKGKWMSDNLKSRITSDLRTILDKPEYQRTRGKLTGTLKEQAILDFQNKIKETFENYTKTDPKYGVPSNIRNIAVTEVRTVANHARDIYMDQLLKRNKDIFITKTFVHNDRASKNARPHHKELNGVTIPKSSRFLMYNRETGRTYRFMYPHDESLPAEETIGCSCEVQYRIEKLTENNKWNYRGQE